MRTLTFGLTAVLCALLGPAPLVLAQDTLTLGTWNIEHLGTGGRGFGGGFGSGSLPRRTDAQLQQIARFIEDTVEADVLVLQEIAITQVVDDVSRSAQLDTIVEELGDGWDYFLPPIAEVPSNVNNLFNALLWNGNTVNQLTAFAMDLPDDECRAAVQAAARRRLLRGAERRCGDQRLRDGGGGLPFDPHGRQPDERDRPCLGQQLRQERHADPGHREYLSAGGW